MNSPRPLALILFVLSIVIFNSCEISNHEPKPQFIEVFRKGNLSANSELTTLINNFGEFRNGRINGELVFTTEMGTLQLDQIIERIVNSEQKAPNYSIRLIPPTHESGRIEYLVLASTSKGYTGYILQFEPLAENSGSLFNSFTGIVRALDLKRNIQSEEYFKDGSQVPSTNSGGRISTIYTDCDCKYVIEPVSGPILGGDISDQAGYDIVIECDCKVGGSGGSGTGTGGIGTPIGSGGDDGGNESGGSGTSGGGAGETIGFEDLEPCSQNTWNTKGQCCPYGVNSEDICMTEEEAKIQELNNLLEQDPFALIEIPCDQLPKWQAVSAIQIPKSVMDRLNFLESQTGGLIDLLSLNDDWELQELKDGNGTAVNMDEFSVKVTLPSSITPESILEHIRTNFLSQLDEAKFTPHPKLLGETDRWNNPVTSLGSILSIDMLDDGSVICIQKTTNSWTFTTIEDPYNFAHPVSGNRQFGFEANSDGSFTFYTRGVDRMTNFVEAAVRDVIKFAFDTDLLDKANPVWASFQNLVADYVKNIGGSAVINNPITHRPNYDELSKFLSGEISVNDLKNCK